MADDLKSTTKLISKLERRTRNVSKQRDAVCRTDITDILRKTASSSEKEDLLQTRNGGYLGIVLRVEEDSAGFLGSFTRNLFDTLGFDPPYKKRLRVYCPFFHEAFETPIPDGATSGPNAAKISTLPNSLFEAENDLANNASYKPGDIVLVTYKCLFPMSGPTLLGPYSNATYSFNGTETSFLGLFNAATADLEEAALGEATSLEESCDDAEPGFEDFRQPASGPVCSVFGMRSAPVTHGEYTKGEPQMHPGIDISQPQGKNIVSSFDGVVCYSQADRTPAKGPVKPRTTEYCYMYIKHKINEKWYITGYFHLLETFVGIGDTVTRGQAIGLSGGAVGSPGSGGTTGPHLHYEFYTLESEPPNGSDPRYLNKNKKWGKALGKDNFYGMTAIDPGVYTGWGTRINDVYVRDTSCLRKRSNDMSFQEALATPTENKVPVVYADEDISAAINSPTSVLASSETSNFSAIPDYGQLPIPDTNPNTVEGGYINLGAEEEV